ncbi:MAG: hypothetical protein GVY17_06135 [Cyanobacteria bacterium]|nr:hypothetical protein [Cyanobacteria bacterium GSL.Bin21]
MMIYLRINDIAFLNRSSIAQYRATFETDNSYCLVQEYKPTPSLTRSR